MDLGLAGWIWLEVVQYLLLPPVLASRWFPAYRVVKSAATAKRGHFHTGTLSPWQLLLTLAQLCSSRALQVAPGRVIHSRVREGAALFYIYSIASSAFRLLYSMASSMSPHLSTSLQSIRRKTTWRCQTYPSQVSAFFPFNLLSRLLRIRLWQPQLTFTCPPFNAVYLSSRPEPNS